MQFGVDIKQISLSTASEKSCWWTDYAALSPSPYPSLFRPPIAVSLAISIRRGVVAFGPVRFSKPTSNWQAAINAGPPAAAESGQQQGPH